MTIFMSRELDAEVHIPLEMGISSGLSLSAEYSVSGCGFGSLWFSSRGRLCFLLDATATASIRKP